MTVAAPSVGVPVPPRPGRFVRIGRAARYYLPAIVVFVSVLVVWELLVDPRPELDHRCTLVAIRKDLDLFGVLVLAGATGLGGGFIRDVLIDQSQPQHVARMASIGPSCWMSWIAVLGPIPRTPGTLSELSPIKPR